MSNIISLWQEYYVSDAVSFSVCLTGGLRWQQAWFLVQVVSAWNSLVVQWLGLGAFIAMAWIQSLVGELRSGKPHGAGNSCQISLRLFSCVSTNLSGVSTLRLFDHPVSQQSLTQ